MNIQNNLNAKNTPSVGHSDREKVIIDLYEAGAVKFGNFTFKSGMKSPNYIDLRAPISYPELFKNLLAYASRNIKSIECDGICGVPYAALPYAVGVALFNKKPLITRRKEVKDHGTQKAIDGVITKGHRYLIIEDVITTGSSILETTKALEHEGLEVKDIVILVDREQGGVNILKKKGYNVHCIFTLSEILTVLCDTGRVDKSWFDTVKQWTAEHQVS